MKLEIDRGSRIVGTKRVSVGGQISGLKKYEGREMLLILLPEEGGISIAPITAPEVIRNAQEFIGRGMENLWEKHPFIKTRFNSYDEALRDFMNKYGVEQVNTVVERMLDDWQKKLKLKE